MVQAAVYIFALTYVRCIVMNKSLHIQVRKESGLRVVRARVFTQNRNRIRYSLKKKKKTKNNTFILQTYGYRKKKK